jgi:hypothetical protein
MPEQAGVFTRASSGLVRQVKAQDVAYYGIQQIALSYIVFIVLAWGAYPGSSMPLASVIAMFGGLAMGICYAMFATLYPRSGGEYVYLSRTLFPVVGSIVSFSFALWETFYTGINGAFFSLYSMSPFLAALGLQTHSSGLLSASDWFAGSWGIFIGGSALIVGLTWLQIRGAGVYFRWQRWATLLEMERLVDQDPVIWTRMIDVDLTGPFLCSRRVLPGMLEARWGRIVMVGSVWGLIGARGATAYCAAKGGLVEMTRAMADEVGPSGVSVTAIAPGTIDTPQLEADARFAGTTLEEMKARYAVDTLVGRIGSAEEIAGVVAFLASDDGAAFSGQSVPVTGGRAE